MLNKNTIYKRVDVVKRHFFSSGHSNNVKKTVRSLPHRITGASYDRFAAVLTEI
jgi:hypothetical protein